MIIFISNVPTSKGDWEMTTQGIYHKKWETTFLIRLGFCISAVQTQASFMGRHGNYCFPFLAILACLKAYIFKLSLQLQVILTLLFCNCSAWSLDTFSLVQSLSCVRLFATPWIEACQASLSILEFTQTHVHRVGDAIQPSHPLSSLLLLPPLPPSIRVFSSESTLRMRWPKYWSFSFSIIPSKEHPDWSPLEWTVWISLQSKGLSRVFSNTRVQKHQFFGAQLSSQSNSHIHTWPQEKP